MSEKYCVYDEEVGKRLRAMATDTYNGIQQAEKIVPGVNWTTMLSMLAHRAATVATNAAVGAPLDRMDSDDPNAQSLIDKIRALPRYDCQGPDGDYGAGMEPGDGYVCYDDLEKLLSQFAAHDGKIDQGEAK